MISENEVCMLHVYGTLDWLRFPAILYFPAGVPLYPVLKA